MSERTTAWMIGLVPIAFVVAVCRLFDVHEDVTAALMVPPVVVAAWRGGRRVGMQLAGLAGVGYAVAFLAPFGHVRIGLTHDMAVLAALVAIGGVVGTAADRRRVVSAPPAAEPVGADLLHAVSHDLRNPLSTIRAASADLLTGGYADDVDKRDELLSLVRSESERLDRIVGNLLHAGRVQTGRFEPELGPESIAAVLAESVGRLRRIHPQPIELEVSSPSPVVLADPVQIDQVVANLVENAARVSPPTAAIRIGVETGSDLVTVRVDDDGPGFPGALGDPFAAHVSATGSTGLGLAVCRAIVTAHGGTITAGRSPSGGGSVRFTLRVHPVSDLG